MPDAHEKTAVQARVLNGLGTLIHEVGDAVPARSALEESLIIRRDIGDQWGIAECLEGIAQKAWTRCYHYLARQVRRRNSWQAACQNLI